MAEVYTTTTVFQSEKVADGEWKLTEIKSDLPEEPDLHSGNRKTLQFDLILGLGVSFQTSLCLGKELTTVAKIGGYYDFDDKEISVTATFGGSPIGTRYTAGLVKGVSIGIDLWAAKGSIRVYGEGGQLKLSYTLGTFFTGDKSDTFVITNL